MNLKIKQIEESEIETFFNYFKINLPILFSHYSSRTIDFFTNNPKAWTLENFKIQFGRATFLTAKADGEIIGLLIVNQPYGGVSFCPYVMVSKNFQRKGIGTALIREWEKIALKQGVHSLSLQTTISEENIEFYKKNGFEIIGMHKKFYFGIDRYVLQKNIQEPKEENFLK